ncbi:MAG: hypothetical protein CMJ58_27515 [Planctomycetaceae bacterium]|nr:hypothetical protein [Planctomycetaceae bacterium]
MTRHDLPAGPATADMLKATDPAPPGGAEHLTRDAATGLEWLNWKVTTDRRDEVIVPQLGVGGADCGWEHASRDEADALFLRLKLPITDWPVASTAEFIRVSAAGPGSD